MPALTFADHERFQKTVFRGLAGAVGVGLVTHLFAMAGLAVPMSVVTVAVCGAVAAAACGSTVRGRAAYGTLGAAAGALPVLFPDYPVFGLAVAGAGIGLVFAEARHREARSQPEAGRPRLGRTAYAAAAALSALALVAGVSIVKAFDARALLDAMMPASLAAMARVGLIGFFAALGSAGAHVARDPDPVEQLYDRLEHALAGDLKVLGARAMTNYRRCAEVLQDSEEGFARSQLSKNLSEVTTRVLELARRWQAIDRELGERAEGEIDHRLDELKKLKESTRDDVAKKQLAVAESALAGELAQIDRIRRGRERVVARLHGEMALLERTRFALLSLKTSDAHLKTAELSALSESLSTVAKEMDCEAEAVDEIISRVVDIRGDGEPLPARVREKV